MNEPDPKENAAFARARTHRWALAGASMVCAATLTMTGITRGLDALGTGYGQVNLSLAVNMRARLDLLKRYQIPTIRRVGFLGDSTVMGYPKRQTVVDWLDRILAVKVGAGFRVFSLAAPGMASLEYYALAGPIVSAHPDQAVVAVNLASLSSGWKERWNRAELLGFVPPVRLFETMQLPLNWWGVTFDRVLLYMALAHSGFVEKWYSFQREQVRLGRALQDLRKSAQGEGGSRGGGLPRMPFGFEPGNPKRFTPDRLLRLYGDALRGVPADHPVLRLLRAALQEFQRAQIPAVVYTVPLNVEYLQRVGVGDREGLGQTIERIGEVATGAGAVFLDLHDLLPDSGFRDAGGHFSYDGKVKGPQMVALRLVERMKAAGLLKPRRRVAETF